MTNLIFKSAFENTPSANIIISLDFKILSVSYDYLAVCQSSLSEIIGKTLFDVFPYNQTNNQAELSKKLSDSLHLVIESKKTHEMGVLQYQLINETGIFKEICWSATNQPILNNNHEIEFIVHHFKAVPNQETIDSITNQVFKALIENSANVITLINSNELITYASPSINKILGYSLSEWLGKTINHFIHADSVNEFMENKYSISKTPNGSFNFQYQFKHKEGHLIWCEGNFTNMLFDENIQAYVANFKDISERKLAEKQVEFDENNIHALINNTNDLMWIVDTNYQLNTYNNAFENVMKKITGQTVIKGQNILNQKLPKEQLNKFKMYYDLAFTGQAFVEIEHITTPFEMWSEICFFPIKKYGSVIGTACYSHDITNQKKAELDRIKITNDLIQRNKDLEQFSYIVSHNLRAPVANIIGLSEAIQDKNLSPEITSEVIRGLNVSVKKLDDVIIDLNNILQTKRDINERKEVVNFTDLMNDISLSISKTIEKENTILTWDFTEINEMLTLKSYLQSIFYNLISNSLKYRQHHIQTQITIKSSLFENKIKLVFKDNGIGIDLKKRSGQVFGLYKRFHPDAAEGKGLGLYMVKTQVETIGGKINIVSEVNKGTEFTIVFSK